MYIIVFAAVGVIVGLVVADLIRRPLLRPIRTNGPVPTRRGRLARTGGRLVVLTGLGLLSVLPLHAWSAQSHRQTEPGGAVWLTIGGCAVIAVMAGLYGQLRHRRSGKVQHQAGKPSRSG